MTTGEKPWLLDLFCCAGGAGMGYSRAGFNIIGVDIDPQPHYPFEFWQMDALEALQILIANKGWFDGKWIGAGHASPPCQRYSDLAKRNGNAEDWPDLVGPVRELLEQADLWYIIENVEGAPLVDPIMLCGNMFDDLRVYRHRLFESNFFLPQPWHPKHREKTFTHDKRKAHYGQPLDLSTMRVQVTGGGNAPVWAKAEAMGIDWMIGRELNESIPPAYTEYLGKQLLAHLESQEAA
jgi:DNA (cytosine-5)-methyltransferase 1